ncbi:hypothetical protein IQ13_0350 [Lacibacter cauensis]|uniref:Uncharacterized protein n=1 Tax=Lacibacter cauensis TaxID=510947 RepID=A0A562SVK6_9BACT|nr:hypothetical protein [Lacibacter cauensis]TWI85193.1 hypothetical protein IQ13_0350 [Lacibacter cauensis]
MIHKAYFSDTTKLINLPETGMGYQVIDAALYGRSIKKRYLVYNAELILDFDDSFANSKKLAFSKSFSSVLNEAQFLPLETSSIDIVKKSQLIDTVRNLSLQFKMMSESTKKDKRRHSGGKGATDSPKENANGSEIFVRLSAFENDKRVDFEKKRLKDGTFTTTQIDYLHCVMYKDDPVDRYALPNDDEIKWAFYVQPKSVDILQRGIVQPAFGHEGGGIEAYFEKGTSEKTYFDKRVYEK